MDDRSAKVRLVISTVRTVRLNVPRRGKCNNFVHFDTRRPLRPVTARGESSRNTAALANYEAFEDRLTLSFRNRSGFILSLLFSLVGLYYVTFSRNV